MSQAVWGQSESDAVAVLIADRIDGVGRKDSWSSRLRDTWDDSSVNDKRTHRNEKTYQTFLSYLEDLELDVQYQDEENYVFIHKWEDAKTVWLDFDTSGGSTKIFADKETHEIYVVDSDFTSPERIDTPKKLRSITQVVLKEISEVLLMLEELQEHNRQMKRANLT